MTSDASSVGGGLGRRRWLVTAYALAFGSLLLLGGALTEYLSWRWTLYVNLFFAGIAFIGGALLPQRQPSGAKPRLDIPGVLLVSGAVFCLVYGFSNAAAHSWDAPSTYGFIAAGAVISGALLRNGPLRPASAPSPAGVERATA
jgi:MFS family permease